MDKSNKKINELVLALIAGLIEDPEVVLDNLSDEELKLFNEVLDCKRGCNHGQNRHIDQQD